LEERFSTLDATRIPVSRWNGQRVGGGRGLNMSAEPSGRTACWYNWHSACQTTLLTAWLTITFPQLFAVASTLKSIDYNVAMTFILNNNNNNNNKKKHHIMQVPTKCSWWRRNSDLSYRTVLVDHCSICRYDVESADLTPLISSAASFPFAGTSHGCKIATEEEMHLTLT